MARRFTAAEKGKNLALNQPEIRRIRVRAPDFDPAELIRENALTLIGRLTNPKEQNMNSVLSYLPKKWNLLGRVAGSDLGNDCFQFQFEEEVELHRVLRERPYQFGRWMIILQRWEPIISPTFPSLIPFWINIKGIPLHYWHEKVILDIGIDLGELDTYQLTKSSARIRILLDGLKPIVKESILELPHGEETKITFEYENLGNHCSTCNCLTHLSSHCPDRKKDDAQTLGDRTGSPSQTTSQNIKTSHSRRSPPREQKIHVHSRRQEGAEDSFQRRVDRHGRPFGQRVAISTHTTGLRNKTTPAVPGQQERNEPSKQVRSQYPSRYYYGHSPAYSTRRERRRTDQEPPQRSSPRKSPPQRVHPTNERSRSTTEGGQNDQIVTPPPISGDNRLPVGRNLESHDFPHYHLYHQLNK